MSPHGVTAAVPHAMPEHYGGGRSVINIQAAACAKQEDEDWKIEEHEWGWWLNISWIVEDNDMNDDDCVAILIRMFLFDCQIVVKTGFELMSCCLWNIIFLHSEKFSVPF